jgi:hypothetical protein
LTLDDKRATTDRLLKAGADIYALNTVRKHLSAIKGGRLAARARGACRTLVISDVVGDDLSVIASGPTVGDASTFHDALDVLRRFGGEEAFPRAVVERIQRGVGGRIAETPAPGDPLLARATTTLIGSRLDALNGAAADAEARVSRPPSRRAGGRRRANGGSFARARWRIRAAADMHRRDGETTVKVGPRKRRAEPGIGARRGGSAGAGMLAMLASAGYRRHRRPTAAAGAIADHTTTARGPWPACARPASSTTMPTRFRRAGRFIHTGPTGTNVGDLQAVLIAYPMFSAIRCSRSCVTACTILPVCGAFNPQSAEGRAHLVQTARQEPRRLATYSDSRSPVRPAREDGLYVGRLQAHPAGTASSPPSERQLDAGGDIYTSARTNEAMHGDRVVVRIERIKEGGRAEGRSSASSNAPTPRSSAATTAVTTAGLRRAVRSTRDDGHSCLRGRKAARSRRDGRRADALAGRDAVRSDTSPKCSATSMRRASTRKSSSELRHLDAH